ncbi:DUF1801 domain-containing protein [Flavobacterium sp. J27]|uniref:DUF1801 domain-containing protein n=1 Tax=Flavobacterium sp. J27 TaxID=2060419 RepID=UPI0010302561|nr:DUF1801 domain-containing protein [Flavobacterium sp. J27]
MNPEIQYYNNSLSETDKAICTSLAQLICSELHDAEYKIWHAHPVWFLNENPIVGYSKQKKGIRLMFWSGADFEENELNVLGPKFKDASIFYTDVTDIQPEAIMRWLQKARIIQWDYKNIVKRKGRLERL